MNLVLRGRGDDAEKFLKEITADGHEDAHRWSTVRAANLIWTLGRPADAAAILEDLAAGPESPTEAASRAGGGGVCRRGLRPLRSRQPKRPPPRWIRSSSDDFHAMMASFALMMALGALGRGDELTAVADRALDRASTSFQTAHLRFWFGGVYARACRLTGRIDDCAKVAKQMADSVNDVPGSGLRQPGVPAGSVRPDARRTARRRQDSCTRRSRASSITASQRVCGLRPASR